MERHFQIFHLHTCECVNIPVLDFVFFIVLLAILYNYFFVDKKKIFATGNPVRFFDLPRNERVVRIGYDIFSGMVVDENF